MVEYALKRGDKVVATLRKPEDLADLQGQYPNTLLLVLKLDPVFFFSIRFNSRSVWFTICFVPSLPGMGLTLLGLEKIGARRCDWGNRAVNGWLTQ